MSGSMESISNKCLMLTDGGYLRKLFGICTTCGEVTKCVWCVPYVFADKLIAQINSCVLWHMFLYFVRQSINHARLRWSTHCTSAQMSRNMESMSSKCLIFCGSQKTAASADLRSILVIFRGLWETVKLQAVQPWWGLAEYFYYSGGVLLCESCGYRGCPNLGTNLKLRSLPCRGLTVIGYS